MTSRERMQAAMNHRQPDRVPVMCQLALGHYFLNCRYRPSDIWFDPGTFAAALVDLQRRYRFDGILVNIPGRPPDWRDRITSRQEREDGEHIRWSSGLETVVPPDDNAQIFSTGGARLPRADYRAVDLADPRVLKAPGYIWNTWHMPELWGFDPQADLSDPAAYPAWFTDTLERVRRQVPDVSVHVEVFSPFTHLMELFGYEQALMALIDVPQTCHRALTVFTKIVLAQVRLYARCQPDAVLVSSAFAGAGFISRAMYQEFVAPYEDEVFRAIHAGADLRPRPDISGNHGELPLPAYVHTCGAIGDRLDLMSETSVDGIDTLDPPPLGTVDLEQAKTRYGRRFFFKGNLDAVHEMLHADEPTFEQAVKDRLRIGKPGGGYILSSACSVAPHVSPARLQQLVPLAEEFGRY